MSQVKQPNLATLYEFKAVLIKYGRDVGRYFDVIAARNLHTLYVTGQTSPVLDGLMAAYGDELLTSAIERKRAIEVSSTPTVTYELKGKLHLGRKLKIIEMVSAGTKEIQPIADALGLKHSHALWYLRDLTNIGVLQLTKCPVGNTTVTKNNYFVTGKPLGEQGLSRAEAMLAQRKKEVIALIKAGNSTTVELATALNITPAHMRLFLNKMADCGELIIGKRVNPACRGRGARHMNIYVLPGASEVAA